MRYDKKCCLGPQPPTPLHLRNLLMNSPPQESETDLPVCSPFSVCSKLDTYGAPFLEKQCRCPGAPCSDSMHTKDGHTIHDRTKQFKVRTKKDILASSSLNPMLF